MKVGLIHPFYNYDKDKNNNQFPFGIAYIANYLIQSGHRAEILDLNVNYLKKNEIISALKDMKCDIIGISSLSGGFMYVKNLTSLIKANLDIPIIVGGPLGTHNPEIVLRHTETDICVIGQGEHISYEILENIEDLKKVKGIVYKDKNDRIIKNMAAPPIPLDEIPWPAYQIMQIQDYIWDGASPDMDSKRRYKKGIRVMQMITGRGCPMECNFCSKVMGKTALLRSIDNVVEEIKFLIKEYKINGISFRDELYLMNKKHAYELASRLKPLNIIWMGQGRVDRVDYELIKHMKECGCISLGFGIESGSSKMLELMNKKQTVEQIENAVRICKKLNMDMKVQLVMGYPGEDRNTVRETVDLFKRIGHPGRRFHLITPLPGSTLYDDLVKKRTIRDELKYLIGLSKRDSGFSRGLPLINLTQFSDEELCKIKQQTEMEMVKNYMKFLRVHPVEILRYLRDKLIYNIDYKKYFSHPLLAVKKLGEKLGLIKHRAIDVNQKKVLERQRWLEYQLN